MRRTLKRAVLSTSHIVCPTAVTRGTAFAAPQVRPGSLDPAAVSEVTSADEALGVVDRVAG
jgi:hypothetical protein